MALRCRRAGAVHSIISDRSLRQRRSRHVRFAPKADKRTLASICPLNATSGCEQSHQTNFLLDHLVGEGDQLIRHMEAKHLAILPLITSWKFISLPARVPPSIGARFP